jgi:hypothetical protein
MSGFSYNSDDISKPKNKNCQKGGFEEFNKNGNSFLQENDKGFDLRNNEVQNFLYCNCFFLFIPFDWPFFLPEAFLGPKK